MQPLSSTPIYNPDQTFDHNFDHGPFGAFADGLTYVNSGLPQHLFLGIPVYSPFGIPAGPLPNARYVIGALRSGFDIVVYKTQRSIEFASNPFPNIVYVDAPTTLATVGPHQVRRRSKAPSSLERLAITNSFGMPSRGPQIWMPDYSDLVTAAKYPGQLVIMSVVGTIQPGFSQKDYYDDFARVASMASAAGAEVIEFNLSCPNVAGEGVLCYTPSAVEAICRQVAEATRGRKLIAKIGYFAPSADQVLADVVGRMAPYISAISAINTVAAAVEDEHGNQALPGEGRRTSGICGAPIKSAGLSMVQRLDQLRRSKGYKYEIIGVGGVMTPNDYDEYRAAGADVVQSATGAMWDPHLAARIKSRKQLH
jgi:dihydroorotate dehydrogenase (NAD+) catalytic subunit